MSRLLKTAVAARHDGRCALSAGPRRGLTLIELMFALTISAIMVGTLGVLASTVRQHAEFNNGQNRAVGQARVTLDRLSRYVTEAYATETYPGVVVVDETIGGVRYPDTVVLWHPTGAPANAAGPPLVRELVLVCPDPSDANRLVEITAPGDGRTIQLNEASLNTSSGRALIAGIKTASSSVKTTLSSQIRSAAAANGAVRSAVRFECELHPSAADLAAYRGGTTTWSALPWPQGMSGTYFGVRQIWLRSELQLCGAEPAADGTLPAGGTTLPFFGSATNYDQLTP